MNAVERKLIECLQRLLAGVAGRVLILDDDGTPGIHEGKCQQALQIGIFETGAIQEGIHVRYGSDRCWVVVVTPGFSPIEELVIRIGLEDERLLLLGDSMYSAAISMSCGLFGAFGPRKTVIRLERSNVEAIEIGPNLFRKQVERQSQWSDGTAQCQVGVGVDVFRIGSEFISGSVRLPKDRDR